MHPVKYVDARFQELAVQIAKEQYSARADAEQNALKFILAVFRYVSAGLFIPLVFINYFMVLVHIRKKPLPQMEILKAQYEALEKDKEAKKQRLGRKIGHNAFN